jgi:hypothetical protein
VRVAIITSVYGDYDDLKEQPLRQTVACEYVAVTDRPVESDTWRVAVEPRPHVHPRLAAKHAKCLPWRYAPDADVTIWVDGSATILSRDFAEMCCDSLGGSLLAQWQHPDRMCVYEEAEVSRQYGKYVDQNIAAQVHHYRQKGHPASWGLWATGCIVRRRDTVHTLMGQSWLSEQIRWTYQDQLSEAPVLRAVELRPASLPEGLWVNQWLSFGRHLGGDS